MGGYLPNAPVNEAAHQFMEKKCSEGKHDKGYMTIPFTTQSWFDPAPGPDPVGSFRFPREMRDKELAQHMLQSNKAFILVCSVDPEIPSI